MQWSRMQVHVNSEVNNDVGPRKRRAGGRDGVEEATKMMAAAAEKRLKKTTVHAVRMGSAANVLGGGWTVVWLGT